MRKYTLTYTTDGNHIDSTKVAAYESDDNRRSLDRKEWEAVVITLEREARKLTDMLQDDPEHWVGKFSGFGYYDDSNETTKEITNE